MHIIYQVPGIVKPDSNIMSRRQVHAPTPPVRSTNVLQAHCLLQVYMIWYSAETCSLDYTVLLRVTPLGAAKSTIESGRAISVNCKLPSRTLFSCCTGNFRVGIAVYRSSRRRPRAAFAATWFRAPQQHFSPQAKMQVRNLFFSCGAFFMPF